MTRALKLHVGMWWQYLIAAFFAILFGYPVLWMIYSSFKPTREILTKPVGAADLAVFRQLRKSFGERRLSNLLFELYAAQSNHGAATHAYRGDGGVYFRPRALSGGANFSFCCSCRAP